MTERLHFHFSLPCTGEGNGNPLQRSYLENPKDRAAWWAAVYGVAQSRTRLKRLSSSSSSFIMKKKKKIKQIPLQGPSTKQLTNVSRTAKIIKNKGVRNYHSQEESEEMRQLNAV